MCERCREDSFVRSDWADPDEAGGCIWPLDDEGADLCPDSTDVVVLERVVDEHLCQRCMKQVEGDLDGGLGDVLRRAGLSATNEFLPFQVPEKCTRCGGPASVVWVSIEASPLCRAHAEENGWLPDVGP